MDIRIHKSFKGFFVERLDGLNYWKYWLPMDGANYNTGMDALLAAREARDIEINCACEKMAINGSLEIEI